MLLSITLAVINYLMNLAGYWMGRLPGLDITPFGIALIVWHGENVFFGTGLLMASYVLVSFHRTQYLVSVVPIVLVTSLLAYVIPWGFVLVILYHVMGVVAAYYQGYLDDRYITFVIVNIPINILAFRLYALF